MADAGGLPVRAGRTGIPARHRRAAHHGAASQSGGGFRGRPGGVQAQYRSGRVAALTRTRGAGPDSADPALPAAARPAGHRGAGAGPCWRLQRGRAAAGPGSRRGRQPACRPGPPGQRPLADPARRPVGLGPAGARTRHRRQHRDHRPRRPRLAVRPGLRAEFPRVRAAGPCRRRRDHPRHRPADVRVRAHGPGSSQVDLRQDGHPHPACPARPRPPELDADRGRKSTKSPAAKALTCEPCDWWDGSARSAPGSPGQRPSC